MPTARRIISLLPSATEIVYALGLEDRLVGVTFECDEPPQARVDKAIVVGGRDTSTMSPREIDTYVRSQAAAGADLYHLHRDALARLDPDLILTQDLCWVCALPSATVADALSFLGCQADVVALDPHTLVDVLATLGTVAERAGIASRGAALVGALRARLDAVAASVAGRPSPRVAVVEWVDPPFPAGHWVPDMVSAAGGTPVAALPYERSREVDWSFVTSARPDVVMVSPCGFHLDGAVAQAAAVASAVPDAQVWAIDGDGLVVRPGPRLVDGVEALASILHPDVVPARPDAVRRVR
ncbi:MAG TPA: ABC transporter substrate-binding protein [Jatrophihabitantaceae bacterium]